MPSKPTTQTQARGVAANGGVTRAHDSTVQRRWRDWRRRGEAGVWATLLALAPAFLLAAVLGVPSPLEPITELIVRLTPVAAATVLISMLGGLARAFALLGALAITQPFGIALALMAPTGPNAKRAGRAGSRSARRTKESNRRGRGGPEGRREEPALESKGVWPRADGQEGPADEPAPQGVPPQCPPAPADAPSATSATVSGSPPPPSVPSTSSAGYLIPSLRVSAFFATLPRWIALGVSAVLLCLPLALAADYSGEAMSALALGALYAPALWLVLALRARQSEGTHQFLGPLESRRAFLGIMASGGIRVATFFALSSYDRWSGALGELLGRGENPRRLFAFAPPAARAHGFPVAGEEAEVTPAAAFYQISKNDVDPQIAPEVWTLRIDGAVARPMTLGYDELLALPRTDEFVTLRCVSNPVGGHLMSTAYFSGVPLAHLLATAGLRSDAGAVICHAADAYDEPLPLALALDPRTLIAYGMNGETLSRTHGGPVRGVVPGYYGFKHVKWLTSVSVLPYVDAGYWERSGWTAASAHSVARIDVTRHSGNGALLVAGVAYTGTRGVSAVQLKVDGGAWEPVLLNIPALSAMTWVQWRATLSLTPGAHTIAARVVDDSGRPQSDRTEWIYPGGAQGLHTVTVAL